MTYPHAVVLGVVQGLTEFLPVSSSGHLILVPILFGWPDQGIAFDAAVHLGTALALLCYFTRELTRLATGVLTGRRADLGLAAAVVVGTIPAGLAGLLFEQAIETRLRSAVVVALASIGWGLVLWWADRQAAAASVGELHEVGVGRGALIGLAQALALIPGTSRSGITITAGLFSGLDRSTAARFAFLLGLPLTAAAGLLKTGTLLRAAHTPAEVGALGAGLLTSFGAGLAAVWFLVHHLRRHSLAPFVVYRIVLGLVILWLVLARP